MIVFVQVLAFLTKVSVCAGAGACAVVPPSVFENQSGGTNRDHCGIILGPCKDHLGSILDNFGPLGTILVPRGIIVETPFLQFGQHVDF